MLNPVIGTKQLTASPNELVHVRGVGAQGRPHQLRLEVQVQGRGVEVQVLVQRGRVLRARDGQDRLGPRDIGKGVERPERRLDLFLAPDGRELRAHLDEFQGEFPEGLDERLAVEGVPVLRRAVAVHIRAAPARKGSVGHA